MNDQYRDIDKDEFHSKCRVGHEFWIKLLTLCGGLLWQWVCIINEKPHMQNWFLAFPTNVSSICNKPTNYVRIIGNVHQHQIGSECVGVEAIVVMNLNIKWTSKSKTQNSRGFNFLSNYLFRFCFCFFIVVVVVFCCCCCCRFSFCLFEWKEEEKEEEVKVKEEEEEELPRFWLLYICN